MNFKLIMTVLVPGRSRVWAPFFAFLALTASWSTGAAEISCAGLNQENMGQSRLVLGDESRSQIVRQTIAEAEALFSKQRMPSRLAICLRPSLREDEGVADVGFIELPLFTSPEIFLKQRAMIFHEYGHHLFLMNIGRHTPSFAKLGDFMEDLAAAHIESKALHSRLSQLALEGRTEDPRYAELKARWSARSAHVLNNKGVLAFMQLVTADIAEVMSDLTAVLAMRDPSAIRKLLEDIKAESVPARDFAVVDVPKVDPNHIHDRLWPLRQAIGRMYLSAPLGLQKKPDEIYENVLAALGRGIERMYLLPSWPKADDINRIFIEELKREKP